MPLHSQKHSHDNYKNRKLVGTMNLTNRPRRLRNGALLRSMVRETRISADTLIYPMFVQEGKNIKEEIASMPGTANF